MEVERTTVGYSTQADLAEPNLVVPLFTSGKLPRF